MEQMTQGRSGGTGMNQKRLRTPAGEKFRRENLGRGFVTAMGIVIILITIALGVFLFIKGSYSFTYFGHSIFDFLFTSEWNPTASMAQDAGGSIGASIYIVGSLITCGLAILLVTPFALGAAIFMTEIAPKAGKRLFQPAVEIFVGIPSIVYGWVGASVLVPLINKIFSDPANGKYLTGNGLSVLAAVLVLTIMIFPTITTVIADTIRGVPDSYRQAAYGMGATRWQTIKTVVIPASSTGIWTGIILGLARAFGEALAVSMVIGRARIFPTDLLSPTTNITGVLASDMSNTVDGSEENAALWSLALLLLLISISFIFLIHFFSGKAKRRLKEAEKAAKVAEKTIQNEFDEGIEEGDHER